MSSFITKLAAQRLALAAIAAASIGASVGGLTAVAQPAPAAPSFALYGTLVGNQVKITDIYINGKKLAPEALPPTKWPLSTVATIVNGKGGGGGNCVVDANGVEWC
jgi:hypothetical protein